MAKDKEKAEVLNALCLLQSFNSKTSSSLGTQHLELEDSHVEESKASLIQPATALRHTEGYGAGCGP